MSAFDPDQWAVLADSLSLARADQPTPRHALDTRQLLEVDRCRSILDELGPVIGSPSRAVTASLLGKRIAFLVVSPSLYAMSMFDEGLDLRLDNCVTDYTHREGAWRSRLILKSLATERSGIEGRDTWRARIVEGIFAGHLSALWGTLQAASGIAPRILWENTAVRVYSLYERRIARLDSSSQRDQAMADFRYLTQDALPGVFGQTENPLARYFFEPRRIGLAGQSTKAIRVRKTCCLYFMATKPAEYCSTCPLLYPAV